MAALSHPEKCHFTASSAKLTFFQGLNVSHLAPVMPLKRREKQDLGGKLGRKAVTTRSLIMTSFLMTALLDPQVSTNLFMTRA